MDWFKSVFSGDPTDLSRVSIAGLVVTVLGVAVYVVAPKLMRKWELPLKLTGVLITLVGALMTMKIF